MESKAEISQQVSQGFLSFKFLIQSLEDDPNSPTQYRSLLSSHLMRYKLWVASLGAHRSSGTSSLEHKLRDASGIRNNVISLLQDLCRLLNEGTDPMKPLFPSGALFFRLSNCSHPTLPTLGRQCHCQEIGYVLTRPDFLALVAQSALTQIEGGEVRLNEDEDHDPLDDELAELLSSDDEDDSSQSDLDYAFRRVGNTIDCLLRLSAAIRNPAPHDFFNFRVKEDLVDAEAFQPLVKNHIRQKFVQISESLADRLAKSAVRRRQYLKYREQHASRIARGLEEAEEGLQCDASEYTATKTVISSIPGHLKDNKDETSTRPFTDEFPDFDDVRSQTSYAPTEANSSELRVPRIPPGYEDGPIKCPFCHMIVTINTRKDWKYNSLYSFTPRLKKMENEKVLG